MVGLVGLNMNPRGVQQMLAEHFQGKRDYRKQLWTLACFVSWRRRFLN